jgi:uncharacterized protein (TIGR02284 family)
MPTDAAKQHEMERALKALINILQDSQRGLADVGEHLTEEGVKRHFLSESLKRANFRAELENELHRAGVADIHETGTTAGALHRFWGDVKAKIVKGDHELLVTAEQGEDVVKKAYADALSHQDLPLPLRQLLAEQQAQVLASHDYVRDHRDVLVSK